MGMMPEKRTMEKRLNGRPPSLINQWANPADSEINAYLRNPVTMQAKWSFSDYLGSLRTNYLYLIVKISPWSSLASVHSVSPIRC